MNVLIVTSNDYGELSNALDFALGGDFRARVLVPERLLARNRGQTHVRLEGYSDLPEILDVLDRERPDVLLLFSGLLLGINGLMSLHAVGELVAAAGGRGVRVATSDPFLGLMTPPEDPSIPALLREHFTRAHEVFGDVPKISIGPSWRGRLAWFNRRVVLDRAACPAGGQGPASWLFVVSTEDHALSVARHGPIGFDRLMREYSRRALAANRAPVVVAPEAFLATSSQFGPPPEGARWLSFLDRAGFSSELNRAEHAFFWNMFSNSTIARFMNRRPVFFLDCGHMARAIPGLTAVALNHYYAGASPAVFGAGEDWSPNRLGVRACAQEEALAAAREAWMRSASPDELIATLLSPR